MSLPRDLDDCVYEIACELAELSADSPWDRVKRIVQRRYKPPLSPYNKDLQGVYEKYYKRRLSDLQADKGLPPTPPDTASLNPPTNSLDRGSDAAEQVSLGERLEAPRAVEIDSCQISPSYNVIRIICTRADSPVKVLPSDSEDLEVSYKEPEKDDWGYYITDQVCETYCAPADIGKEVEVTYQWIGEKDERKGHFVVREAMNMGADVVCPRADPDDIMMVEGMQPRPTRMCNEYSSNLPEQMLTRMTQSLVRCLPSV